LTIIQSGLRDTTNSLDRYCLYILYKDLQLESFWRIDKGNLSDTEVQMAAFTLTNKRAPDASPSLCRSAFNDSVTCQAYTTCGWCQIGSIGSCYEPEQRAACQHWGGAYVGPIVDNTASVTTQEAKEFIELQYTQQLKGLYPVVKNGNTITWTIHGFSEIDFFAKTWTSAIFEANGAYWKFTVYLFNKRVPSNKRFLNVVIEAVDGSQTGKFELTAVNIDSTTKLPTQSFHQTFTRGVTKSSTLGNFQDLADKGYIRSDTVKFSFTILEGKP